MGNDSFSMNDVGKTGQICAKNEIGPFSHTIHKNELKIYLRLKCKTLNHKNPRRKQAVISPTFLIVIFSLIDLLQQRKQISK